jgi:LuxR family maltose regulon positive regulatory protein
MSLAVKSGRPFSHEGLVARPRLVERLRGAGEAQVLVVTAPAGYGKTSLLADWADSEVRPSVWVALEQWHDDPLVLTREIVERLGEVEPFEERLLAALESAEEPEPATSLLASLASALEARELQTALILDDLHLLRSRTALLVVATVAEHLPSGSLLAIASRSRPHLPLGRLRAHRALLELDAGDLAMTREEAASLLLLAGARLRPEQVDELLARTEGWPAALYLAALSLREHSDPGVAIARFSGQEEVVAEYLRDELLDSLPSSDFELLVGSSVCDTLSGPLCDALLSTSGSARALERLARGPLPFEATCATHDRYRCHRLLRELVYAELLRAGPDRDGRNREVLAHARACAWYASRGDLDRAISHAISAGELELTGELLWEHLPDYIPVGRNDILQSHLSRLTEEQIVSSPTLALTAAHSALSLGRMRHAEHFALAAAAALAHAPAPPEPASLRAGIAVIEAAVARNGVAPMGDEAARAHDGEDEHSPWRSSFSLLSGVSAHLMGDLVRAREHLEEGAHRSALAAPSIEMLCLSQLALLTAEEGDVERAVEQISGASALLERHSLAAYPIAALALAVSADLSARAGAVVQAKRDAARALALLERLGDFIPWYGAEARIALARAELRLLDLPGSRTLLAQASRLARRVPDAILLARWLEEGWDQVDSAASTSLSGPATLTLAELRILRFLPTHLSFREIGERLHVSTNTVKTQAHAVYRKLGVGSRSHAVARAREIGLLEDRG